MDEHTGSLDILIVEDTAEYRSVAEGVARGRPDVSIRYAATYEEALDQIERKRPDGVVTDLFFPSDRDWRAYLKEHISIGAERECAGDCDYNPTLSEQERIRAYARELHGVVDRIGENPSGVGMVLECGRREIPVRILSQGDRHDPGDLADVRVAFRHAALVSPEVSTAMPEIREPRKSGEGVYSYPCRDPIADLAPYLERTNTIDKSRSEQWIRAFDVLKTDVALGR